MSTNSATSKRKKKRGQQPRRFNVARAKRLYEAGQSLQQIAPQVGVSSATVRKGLVAAGTAMRHPGGQPRQFDADKARELYTAGYGLARTGRMLGISGHSVRVALQAQGVQIRPPRTAYRQPPVLDEQQTQQVKTMYEAGKTIRQIAHELQTGRTAVYKALRRAGVQMRDVRAPRAKRLPAAKRAAIIEQLRAGLRLTDVHRNLQVGVDTVRKVAAEEGIEPRKAETTDQGQVLRLHLEGKTVEAIAEAVGCSPSNVSRILGAQSGKPRRTRRLWSPADKAKANQLREEGKTYAQIAAIMGRTTPSIAGFFQEQRREETSRQPAGR